MASNLERSNNLESFRVGYHECLTETMHFLVEKEGLYSGDAICVRLMSHLQKHYDQLGKASTSEILTAVTRKWIGSTSIPQPQKGGSRDRGEDAVKSENSEESGYFSVKQEEDASEVVNLTTGHQKQEQSGSLSETYTGGREEREPSVYRRRSTSAEQYSRTDDCTQRREEEGPRGELTQEQPSDFSRKGEADGSDSFQSNLYKFKTNIRQRFDMQDHGVMGRDRMSSINSEPDPSDGMSDRKRLSLDPSENLGVEDMRRLSGDLGRPTVHQLPGPLNEPRHQDDLCPRSPPPPPVRTSTRSELSPAPVKNASQTVPIFALNSRGSYYVPMTVDISIISPFMSVFTEESCPILHPVTISVNFQSPHIPPARSAVIQQASVIKHWRDQPGI